MRKPISWGIAGFGWVASDFMAPAIREAGDRLIAIADPSPRARSAAEALGITALDSIDELVVRSDVEAIYIATPNHLHRCAIEAAASAGKAVLCEKPIAATFADAEAAVAACVNAGVLYGTAFDQRHHPAHRKMRSVIAEGRIGTVTAVRVVYACWLGPDWSSGHDGGDNWRADTKRAGGGAFMDLAPHGLDLVDFLINETVVDGTAVLQRRVHEYDVDDGAMFVGRTSGGVLVSLHVAYNMPDALPRRRLEITGSRGLLIATDTMGQTSGGELHVIDAKNGSAERISVPDEHRSPFVGQVHAFGTALRGGDRTDFNGPRDLANMRLLRQAYSGTTAL